MSRLIVIFIVFVLSLSAVVAEQVDQAMLRSRLEVPVTMSIGINFTHLFTPERIPSNPKAEIIRLQKQLTGKPSDAPLHLRMAKLYGIIDAGSSDPIYEKERSEQYKLAAQQYKTLLEEKPDDPQLVVGYARSRHGGAPSSDNGLFSVPEPGLAQDALNREVEGMLRDVIKAHPEEWEAYLELAKVLENRAVSGVFGSMMRGQMEPDQDAGKNSEEIDADTQSKIAEAMKKLPEALSKEEVERLFKEASEQRGLAVKFAPKQPKAYISRFTDRFSTAFLKFMFLNRMMSSEEKMDKAATLKLVKEVINPSDLRKALQYDPANATILRTLVFFEIANVLLDESTRRPFKDLYKNILNEDPSKRTWNIISGGNKAKLAKYEGIIREVIKKRPDDVWAAYEALGLMKAFQGERKEAETAFTVAAKLSARADLSYMALFAAKADPKLSGDTGPDTAKKVIPIWEMRAKLSNSPSDILNLAWAYTDVDRLDKAESLARQVLKKDDKNAVAHHLLGVALLKRQSDPKEAIEHLEKAVALSNDEYTTSTAGYNLGVAYAIAGNIDKAREVLGKVSGPSGPYNKALKMLEEFKVGRGHVIYSPAERVYINPGIIQKWPSREKIDSFTAEAGSIIIVSPTMTTFILRPESKIDPPNAPENKYEPGRIAIIYPDGSDEHPLEGSTMEILTAPRTFTHP